MRALGERKPHTSRSNSCFGKTRCGSSASRASSSNSLPDSVTGCPLHAHAARALVDDDLARLQHVAVRANRAAQHRADAREQLVVHERLRHVVVAAAVERTHAVDGVGVGLAHQDERDVAVPAAAGLALAQAPAELEACGVRERGAHEDEIRPRTLGELERLAARACAYDLEPVLREMTFEEPARGVLRLGEEEGRRHRGEANIGFRGGRDVLSRNFATVHRQSSAANGARRGGGRSGGCARSDTGLAARRSASTAAHRGRRRAQRQRARRRRRLRPVGGHLRAGRRVHARDAALATAARPSRRREPRDGRDVARQGDRRRRLRRPERTERPRVRARERPLARARATARGTRGRRRGGDRQHAVRRRGDRPRRPHARVVRARPASQPLAADPRTDAARAPRRHRDGRPRLRARRSHRRSRHEPPNARELEAGSTRLGTPSAHSGRAWRNRRDRGRPLHRLDRWRGAGWDDRQCVHVRHGARQWRHLPDLPTPRHGLGVVATGRTVYAIAGGPQPGLTTSGAVEHITLP